MLQIYFICLYLTIFVKDSVNMKINILLFGITRDLAGTRNISFEIPPGTTVAGLKKLITERYPALGDLDSVAVAVNNEYAGSDLLIREHDEIALLPPVSGG